ncbi:hypothetical protein WA158_006509 [Blastocystis sp. Blastoise]
MCGVIGVMVNKNSKIDVSKMLITGLTMLQHRGQDACGICVCDDHRSLLHKDNGLISKVFPHGYEPGFDGYFGIGHVRYPTAGTSTFREAQPFYTNYPYGLALAHNGNIINCAELRQQLITNFRGLVTSSDSELLLNIFADELVKRVDINNKNEYGIPIPTPRNIFDAVDALRARVTGAYAVVASIQGVGLVFFRDPNGIRPLIYGKYVDEEGRITAYAVASESASLEALHMTVERDCLNGETIFIDTNLNVHCDEERRMAATCAPCLFEYVYFARPESVIDNISVYNARLRMGNAIADVMRQEGISDDVDVVCSVPDTSRHTAIQVAESLGKPYIEGINKNRYVARTFIMPGQTMRVNSVKLKHMPIDESIKGKNVLLVDDSIVRGTTSKVIIQLMRDAGAKKVFFASACPPVIYRNIYGIDMPTQKELLAYNRSFKEIEEAMGCDRVIYPTLDQLYHCCKDETIFGPTPDHFESSVFDGDLSDSYINQLEASRGENSKQKKEALQNAISSTI